MSAYDLTTHLGAYLCRQDYFRSSGVISFVTYQILEGYIDASGNVNNPTDKILVVGGCLSTPEKWQKFTNEWQSYLSSQGFKLGEFGRCVYHATDVMNCENLERGGKEWNKKLLPDDLTPEKAQVIHRHIIGIICKHTLHRFGFAVLLDELKAFDAEYPEAKELFYGRAGSLLSRLCLHKNQMWAEKYGFSSNLSYIFDRGDEFWGYLNHVFQYSVTNFPDSERTAQNITSENKAEFVPIQAADVVVWECSQLFRGVRPADFVFGSNASHILPQRPEMSMLLTPAQRGGRFRLYDKESLRKELHYNMKLRKEAAITPEDEETLRSAGIDPDDIDIFTRHMLKGIKQNRLEQAKQHQEAAKKRRDGNAKN